MKASITVAAFTAFVAADVPAIAVQPFADSTPFVIATSHQAMIEVEIRKVDPAATRISIKHGEPKNLDMPTIFLVFRVNDPAIWTKVKAGNKVKFRDDKIDGAYILVKLDPVKRREK